MDKKTVYEIISDQIIASLETGNIPWRKPWKSGMPLNIRGTEYRGINTVLLSLAAFETPIYATYNQIKNDMGGQVRKGEKGFPVVFWKALERKKNGVVVTRPDGKPETFPIMRYYTVFNIDQADIDRARKQEIVDALIKPVAHKPIDAAETIVHDYLGREKVGLHTGGARAFYRPSEDSVNMPALSAFDTPEEYYSTLFHECGHSTGHEKRLAREGIAEQHYFGDPVYSFEELIAEMSAAMSCGRLRLEQVTLKNSGAYIKNWLGVLKGDPKMVVRAGGQAQKATDLIFGDVKEKK